MTAPLDVSPVVGLGHQQAVRKESSTEKRSDVFKQRPTPRTSAAGAVKRVGRYLGAIRNLSKKKAVEHDSGDDGESYGHQSTIDGPQIHADEAQRSLLRVDLDGSLTNNRSHVSQLELELGHDMQRSEEDSCSQLPEPRHVKFATKMAEKLRRGSNRANLAENRQRVINSGMTPEERKELIRVQREVMWNLQRANVVTIVRPGDAPVPYKRQGNPAVNTPQGVRLRQALRKAPLIQEISNEYWCFPGLNPDGSSEMSKESYIQLNRKLHLALVPDTTNQEASRSAEEDWFRDTARSSGRMTKEAFFSSMFELADIWTENIDEEEYTALLWLLLETITNTTVVPPSFKADRDIECIVDKDLEAATECIPAVGDASDGDRVSLPLDIDAAGAALGANCEQGAILSPQLKDKHIQRLRALRERLQALKQLRSPPREPSDSGSDGFEVIAVRNGEPLPREDGPVGRGGKDYETPEASDGILEGAHVEEVEDSTVTFGALKKRGDTRSVGDHLVNQDDQSEDDRGLFSADDGLTGGGERFTPRRASLKGNSGMLIPGHIRQQKSWASPYHSGDEARKADVEARTDFELGLDQGAEDYHGRQARAEGGGRSFAHETSGLTAQGVIDHTDIPEGVPPDDETDQGQSIGINFETTIAAVPGGIVTARSSTEVPQQKEILASKGSKAMVERSDREQWVDGDPLPQQAFSEGGNRVLASSEVKPHSSHDRTSDKSIGHIQPSEGSASELVDDVPRNCPDGRMSSSVRTPVRSTKNSGGESTNAATRVPAAGDIRRSTGVSYGMGGGNSSAGKREDLTDTLAADLPETLEDDEGVSIKRSDLGRGINLSAGEYSSSGHEARGKGQGGSSNGNGDLDGAQTLAADVDATSSGVALPVHEKIEEDRCNALADSPGIVCGQAEIKHESVGAAQNPKQGGRAEVSDWGQHAEDDLSDGKTAGGNDAASAARDRRQLQRRRADTEQGSSKVGRRQVSSNSRRRSSRESRAEVSHFRPAGGTGAWEGISRTTDEQWEKMIAQAREERQHHRKPRQRRAVSRKRALRDDPIRSGSFSTLSSTMPSDTRSPMTNKTGNRNGWGDGGTTDASISAEKEARTHDPPKLSAARREHKPEKVEAQKTVGRGRSEMPWTAKCQGSLQDGELADESGNETERRQPSAASTHSRNPEQSRTAENSPTSPETSTIPVKNSRSCEGNIADEMTRRATLEDTVRSEKSTTVRNAEFLAAGANSLVERPRERLIAHDARYTSEAKTMAQTPGEDIGTHHMGDIPDPIMVQEMQCHMATSKASSARQEVEECSSAKLESGAAHKQEDHPAASMTASSGDILARLHSVLTNHNLKAQDVFGSKFAWVDATAGSAVADVNGLTTSNTSSTGGPVYDTPIVAGSPDEIHLDSSLVVNEGLFVNSGRCDRGISHSSEQGIENSTDVHPPRAPGKTAIDGEIVLDDYHESVLHHPTLSSRSDLAPYTGSLVQRTSGRIRTPCRDLQDSEASSSTVAPSGNSLDGATLPTTEWSNRSIHGTVPDLGLTRRGEDLRGLLRISSSEMSSPKASCRGAVSGTASTSTGAQGSVRMATILPVPGQHGTPEQMSKTSTSFRLLACSNEAPTISTMPSTTEALGSGLGGFTEGEHGVSVEISPWGTEVNDLDTESPGVSESHLQPRDRDVNLRDDENSVVGSVHPTTPREDYAGAGLDTGSDTASVTTLDQQHIVRDSPCGLDETFALSVKHGFGNVSTPHLTMEETASNAKGKHYPLCGDLSQRAVNGNRQCAIEQDQGSNHIIVHDSAELPSHLDHREPTSSGKPGLPETRNQSPRESSRIDQLCEGGNTQANIVPPFASSSINQACTALSGKRSDTSHNYCHAHIFHDDRERSRALLERDKDNLPHVLERNPERGGASTSVMDPYTMIEPVLATNAKFCEQGAVCGSEYGVRSPRIGALSTAEVMVPASLSAENGYEAKPCTEDKSVRQAGEEASTEDPAAPDKGRVAGMAVESTHRSVELSVPLLKFSSSQPKAGNEARPKECKSATKVTSLRDTKMQDAWVDEDVAISSKAKTTTVRETAISHATSFRDGEHFDPGCILREPRENLRVTEATSPGGGYNNVGVVAVVTDTTSSSADWNAEAGERVTRSAAPGREACLATKSYGMSMGESGAPCSDTDLLERNALMPEETALPDKGMVGPVGEPPRTGSDFRRQDGNEEQQMLVGSTAAAERSEADHRSSGNGTHAEERQAGTSSARLPTRGNTLDDPRHLNMSPIISSSHDNDLYRKAELVIRQESGEGDHETEDDYAGSSSFSASTFCVQPQLSSKLAIRGVTLQSDHAGAAEATTASKGWDDAQFESPNGLCCNNDVTANDSRIGYRLSPRSGISAPAERNRFDSKNISSSQMQDVLPALPDDRHTGIACGGEDAVAYKGDIQNQAYRRPECSTKDLALSLAQRIADADGTRYDKALAEVRQALQDAGHVEATDVHELVSAMRETKPAALGSKQPAKEVTTGVDQGVLIGAVNASAIRARSAERRSSRDEDSEARKHHSDNGAPLALRTRSPRCVDPRVKVARASRPGTSTYEEQNNDRPRWKLPVPDQLSSVYSRDNTPDAYSSQHNTKRMPDQNRPTPIIRHAVPADLVKIEPCNRFQRSEVAKTNSGGGADPGDRTQLVPSVLETSVAYGPPSEPGRRKQKLPIEHSADKGHVCSTRENTPAASSLSKSESFGRRDIRNRVEGEKSATFHQSARSKSVENLLQEWDTEHGEESTEKDPASGEKGTRGDRSSCIHPGESGHGRRDVRSIPASGKSECTTAAAKAKVMPRGDQRRVSGHGPRPSADSSTGIYRHPACAVPEGLRRNLISSDHRDTRTTFSSGRPRTEPVTDTRTMPWQSGGASSSYFGWREAPANNDKRQSEEAHEPFYIDAKQVRYFPRHYPPELGLPPWRTPAPGEPGWEAILNYCEVKMDEQAALEERKRRDFLCRRRFRNRGQASFEEHSPSLGGNSGGPQGQPGSNDGTDSARANTGLEPELAYDSEDCSKNVIAQRINAQARGATSGVSRQEMVRQAAVENHTHCSYFREDDEKEMDWAQAKDETRAETEAKTFRQSPMGVMAVQSVLSKSRGSMCSTMRLHDASSNMLDAPSTDKIKSDESSIGRPSPSLSGGNHEQENLRGADRNVRLADAISAPSQGTTRHLKSFEGSNNSSQSLRDTSLGILDRAGSEVDQSTAGSSIQLGRVKAQQQILLTAGCSPCLPSALDARNSIAKVTTVHVNANSQGRQRAASATTFRPSTSSGMVEDPETRYMSASGSKTGHKEWALQAPLTVEQALIRETANEITTQNDSFRAPTRRRRQRAASTSSIPFNPTAFATTAATRGKPLQSVSFSREGCVRRRRSVSPMTALAQSYEHRRQSEILRRRIAASSEGGTLHPQSSMPGSRWAEDVQLHPNTDRKAQLVPATRTAGRRWGSNHGRLESLFVGERIFEGPWVLDTRENERGSSISRDEHEDSLRYIVGV